MIYNIFKSVISTHYSKLVLSMSLNEERLTHLKQLEAESIHIIREVAAEFENPVMLYSIGKDSAVMLHLSFKSILILPNFHSHYCM